MIFCTAGHVDHGKTALVRALTGVDTDRLAEERRRGLTIELGFAPLELPGVGRVSLVDVPGHAQFIPTMLSGCGGLDGALFTVAADEGPMPQTAEHLDILSLLGLERGVVALTRADLASPAARAEAEARTRALTAGTFLEGAPRIFVSAVTGEGLEALRAALAAMARQAPPPPEGSPRLHVDRVFSVDGSGTVVTGTVRSVRHHIFVTWNTQSFVNVPGRNSPWSAVCGYTWGGRDYTVSTGLLWGEPQEGAEVLVWLDPDRPGRAFVDPDSVRLDLMG